MTGYYELPVDLGADIDAYDRDVGRFLAGDMPAAIFKAKRVPRGIYEQRQDGVFMLRVRVAGGTLNVAQTRELAALSREFGSGLLHITTRQDVQFHDVAIGHTPAMMRRLLAAGLTSKGGGGNTVRNVAACPYAGICPAERFDVTPCAHAVTAYLIALVGSYNLPRKYKIAFSGCRADCALAQVADLGFIAEVRDGQPGFRVMAGGGMGAQSRIADPLLDWTPATDIVRVAETVRRLFDQLGDRSNKHRARLRFVFDRIGVAAFRQRFAERMAETVRDGVPEWLHCPPLNDNAPAGDAAAPRLETRAGIRVVAQRQPGYVAVPLHAPLGFLPADDLARLGGLAGQFSGESGVRTTRTQDLLLRSVKEADLPALAAGLHGLQTEVLRPTPLDRFVACAGASTCRMGICLARGAARACADALAQAGVAREALDALSVHINGCPNACGQQPVGAIGCSGVAQRVQDRLVPSYAVTVGGRCGATGARFGMPVGKVPAAALPAFVAELGTDFASRRAPGESFADYVDRVGTAYVQSLAARHAAIPGFSERPEFYRDWGAEEDFSLAGRGAGECGAGVFEVIQQDLAAAKQAIDPFGILIPAVRALLVTRGVDARDPDTVLREFERHFIDSGLVEEEARPLLNRARGYLQGWTAAFEGQEQAVTRLRDGVERLYATLDANLEFHPAARPSDRPAANFPLREGGAGDPRTETAAVMLDLSGVPCPMNFVKAKLKLETMRMGETLGIVLDDGEPIRNVPASLKGEGQDVESIAGRPDGRWLVTVRKRHG